MTDSSYLRCGLVLESTPNTTPSTYTHQLLELTSQSIQHNMQKTRSTIITSDRQLKDSARLSRSSGGGLSTELTYPTVDEALWTAIRASMCSAAELTTATVANCSSTVASEDITRASGSFVSDGFTVGDLVIVSGSADPDDNVIAPVAVVAALTLTLRLADGYAFTLANAAALTVKKFYVMPNGLTRRYYSVEMAWLDTQKMIGWTGQTFDTMDISASIGSITTISFGLYGISGTAANMVSSTQGFAGTPTYVTVTNNPVFDPVGVIAVVIQGTTYPCNSFSLNVRNGARPKPQFGSPFAASVNIGQFEVSGSFSAYFEVVTLLSLLEADTTVDIYVVMKDENNKYFGWTLNSVELDTASIATRGINSDEIVNVSFTAKKATNGYTLKMQRFHS